MDKLFENVKKELKQIETNGLSSSNLETAYKLTCIGKNIKEIEEKEGEEKMKERYMDAVTLIVTMMSMVEDIIVTEDIMLEVVTIQPTSKVNMVAEEYQVQDAVAIEDLKESALVDTWITLKTV